MKYYDLNYQNEKLKENKCKHRELFPSYRLFYKLDQILKDYHFLIFDFSLLNLFVRFLSFMLHLFLNNLFRKHYKKKVFHL